MRKTRTGVGGRVRQVGKALLDGSGRNIPEGCRVEGEEREGTCMALTLGHSLGLEAIEEMGRTKQILNDNYFSNA